MIKNYEGKMIDEVKRMERTYRLQRMTDRLRKMTLHPIILIYHLPFIVTIISEHLDGFRLALLFWRWKFWPSSVMIRSSSKVCRSSSVVCSSPSVLLTSSIIFQFIIQSHFRIFKCIQTILVNLKETTNFGASSNISRSSSVVCRSSSVVCSPTY